MEGLVVDARSWQGKRVLITGHTGFKGSWLSFWLARLGAKVYGFSNGIPTTPSLYKDASIGDHVESLEGDIRDANAVHRIVDRLRPEAVFHLAAQALVRQSYLRPVETFEVNVIGTANVLEAACGVADIVIVVTSDKCYAPSEDGLPHRETDALGGLDPYSSSKACAEHVAAAYRSFGSRGTRVASVRAGNVIGGGDWAEDRLLPDLIRGALAGCPVAIRNPQSVRPWQHVLNPLEGYLLLAQRSFAKSSFSDAWNFGPDHVDERSVGWIADRFSLLWDGDVATVVDETPQPPETTTLRLESTKARTRLGWRPRWGIDEALRRVVEWTLAYREHGDVQRVLAGQLDAHQAATVAA